MQLLALTSTDAHRWEPKRLRLRLFLPRLHGEHRRTNIALADRLRPIGDRFGASIAQLAIAWVLAQGAEHADVVAIVGAARPDRIADNLTAAHLQLSQVDLADIEHAVPRSAAAGARYAAPLMAMLDSEQATQPPTKWL